jgi:biotin carboxylase
VETLLFLGASISQAPAIRQARRAGFRIVAVDGDPNAAAFPFAHVAEAVDFTDVEQVVAVARRAGVDGVLSICTDRGVVPAAQVAEALGLPGIGVDVAQAMTDKQSMRARLAGSAIRQPAHVAVTGEADLRAALERVPLPAVLKPVDSGGQRGLFMIRSPGDAFARLQETLALSRRGAAMLESYVEGTELNVLLVMRDGVPTMLTASDRLRPAGDGFGVGWIHSYPSSLPDAVLDEVRSVSFAAVAALGLRNGIAFPQLIATDDEVYLVEVAARIAAGQMTSLVRLGTGIDLFEIAFAQALGKPIRDEQVTAKFQRPIAIRFLTAEPGVLPVGAVSEIAGLKRVRRARGVLEAGLYFDVGAEIRPLQVDADRNGYVIATAGSPAAALSLADKAAEKLVIRTGATDPRLSGSQARPRRSRLPAFAVIGVLVLASIGALAVTEAAKLQRPLVTGTRVDKVFAPLCHCSTQVAHIRLRLTRRARVTIDMVTASGHPVSVFVRKRMLGPGWVTLTWLGKRASGVPFPNGSYLPQIDFVTLGRNLRLPSPIRIDDRAPRILRAVAHARGSRLVVRYAFDEPAYAALLVDGRRKVLTRFALLAGALRWRGRFHRLGIGAIDLAGNRSRTRVALP